MNSNDLSQEYVRESYDNKTIINRKDFNEIKNHHYLFLNKHKNEYHKLCEERLYTKSNEAESLPNDQKCGKVADIYKMFFSLKNIIILGKFIHKRVSCEISSSCNKVSIEGLKSIYPIIGKDIDSKKVRDFFTIRSLTPMMDEVYSIYAEDWNHELERQIDRLNYIVILQMSDKIITDIKFHTYYLQDISNPLQVNDFNQINTNTNQTLPSTFEFN